MKTIINTTNAPAPIGPYSQAVAVNGLLYVSGQIPMNPATGEIISTDIKAEAKQVMENLDAILKEAGSSFAGIVKSTIFLTDMGTFADVNEVYGSYFTSDFPARETVQVSALPKGVNVEISVIAIKP
ncbi:RidA family protein [Mucilaginibacter pallidiroseus]|uniref:RidA family protein n=1 Tax=Mucilaginibacter pallidiroseus TaxID=2599295 RepID=A0A563TXG2_9SPHI|nr:RidA family protein [Mucilaginibacter pallidiroseus]TWR24058.1 RidA family protein [Mucilaginibacter pallidiroseus]